MLKNPQNPEPHNNPLARGIIEVAFIVFLFYSNLLMGQYTAGNTSKPLLRALHDIFTAKNLTIAIGSALIGYVVFEYLRRRS